MKPNQFKPMRAFGLVETDQSDAEKQSDQIALLVTSCRRGVMGAQSDSLYRRMLLALLFYCLCKIRIENN